MTDPNKSRGDDERLRRAIQALVDNAEVLARRIAAEERRVIPAYAAVEEHAHAKRIEGLMRGIAKSALTGTFDSVLQPFRNNMQLVMTAGVQARDFLHVSYTYLSIMRKVIVAASEDPREGLRDWDALEAKLLGIPLRTYVKLSLTVEEPTMPGTRTVPFPPDVSSMKTDEEER